MDTTCNNGNPDNLSASDIFAIIVVSVLSLLGFGAILGCIIEVCEDWQKRKDIKRQRTSQAAANSAEIAFWTDCSVYEQFEPERRPLLAPVDNSNTGTAT